MNDAIPAQDDPAAWVEQHEGQTQLLTALAHLPERDRHLLALRFGHRLTNRAIARLLHADERTVSVWILRAMRRLRVLLEENV